MPLTRRRFIVLGVSLVGTPQGSGAAVGRSKLAGQVVDKGNKPIASVLVTAYRAGQKIGQATTDGNGNYSIEFDQGTTITTVQYQVTGYIDAVVNDLCGDCGHSISKTMYLQGTNLNLFEAQESLSALERVYYLEELNKRLAELRENYMGVLNEMKVPARLAERFSYVKNLYETRKTA